MKITHTHAIEGLEKQLHADSLPSRWFPSSKQQRARGKAMLDAIDIIKSQALAIQSMDDELARENERIIKLEKTS